MTRHGLEVHYRRYIACLNDHRLDDAEAFYADELLYNGKPITRGEWRRTAIEDSFDAMPDLQWRIEQLVIEGRTFAARLHDIGTLRKPWRGITPTGEQAGFGEHAFYRFRDDGRIDEVWSSISR